MNKFIGVLLIIVGTALALWGYDIYDSVSSQFTRAFSGQAPLKAWGGMIGGAVCILIGISRIK